MSFGLVDGNVKESIWVLSHYRMINVFASLPVGSPVL